jgi:Protein of unknown function (DUF3343).
MEEIFGIGAFRSRQQVMRFESALKRQGVRVSVISTPRDVSVGCGLSVRFEMEDAAKVMAVYKQSAPGNLIGFYHVHRKGQGRPQVTALS